MRLVVHIACFQEWCTRLGLMRNSKIPNCARKKTAILHRWLSEKDASVEMFDYNAVHGSDKMLFTQKNSKKITSEKRLENIWKRKCGIWEIAHLSVISCKGTLRVDKLSSSMLMFIGPAGCRMVDCWSSQSQSNPWLRRIILHIYPSFVANQILSYYSPIKCIPQVISDLIHPWSSSTL